MLRWIGVPGACLVLGTLAGCGVLPDSDEVAGDVSSDWMIETDWSESVGAGVHGEGDALDPVIEGAEVLTIDRNGRLEAHAPDSGERLWRLELDLPASAGPAADARLIVVGARDGRVLALDRSDRTVVWQFQTSSEVLAKPLLLEQTVVVMSQDGRVFGLRPESGALRWVHDRTAPSLTLRGLADPLESEGRVIVGLPNGRIIALDADTGTEVWEARAGVPSGRSDIERMRDILGRLVLDRGVVFGSAYQGDTVAIGVADGSVGWRRALSSIDGVAADATRVYVAGDDGVIWALDRRSGDAAWRQEQLRGARVTAPTVLGGALVVLDSDGYLSVMETAAGRLVARQRLNRDGFSRPPLVSDSVLFALADDGRLYRLVLRPPR